jgi:Rho-type GTPase-activating protein 1/2
MDYEGIYRKAGGKIMVRSIVSAFQNGEDIDLNNEDEYNDVSAITSVLKQYLGELSDPLFTYVLYPRFIEAAGTYKFFEDIRTRIMQHLIFLTSFRLPG